MRRSGTWEQTPCLLHSVEPRPAQGSGPLLWPPCKFRLLTCARNSSYFYTMAWVDAATTRGTRRSTEALGSPFVSDFAGKDTDLRSLVNIVKLALFYFSPCSPSPCPLEIISSIAGTLWQLRILPKAALEGGQALDLHPEELAVRCMRGLSRFLLSWEATLPAVAPGNSGKRPAQKEMVLLALFSLRIQFPACNWVEPMASIF